EDTPPDRADTRGLSSDSGAGEVSALGPSLLGSTARWDSSGRPEGGRVDLLRSTLRPQRD
ncbi:MAG: hypothetical protein ABSE49_10960, partial [Polyangiaceae bacterium]